MFLKWTEIIMIYPYIETIFQDRFCNIVFDDYSLEDKKVLTKIWPKFISKHKIYDLSRAYSINLAQRSILARKETFL